MRAIEEKQPTTITYTRKKSDTLCVTHMANADFYWEDMINEQVTFPNYDFLYFTFKTFLSPLGVQFSTVKGQVINDQLA